MAPSRKQRLHIGLKGRAGGHIHMCFWGRGGGGVRAGVRKAVADLNPELPSSCPCHQGAVYRLLPGTAVVLTKAFSSLV